MTNKEIPEEVKFLQFAQQQKDKFVSEINYQEWNGKLRLTAENFLLAFEQLWHRHNDIQELRYRQQLSEVDSNDQFARRMVLASEIDQLNAELQELREENERLHRLMVSAENRGVEKGREENERLKAELSESEPTKEEAQVDQVWMEYQKVNPNIYHSLSGLIKYFKDNGYKLIKQTEQNSKP